jgi:hypothetical protein
MRFLIPFLCLCFVVFVLCNLAEAGRRSGGCSGGSCQAYAADKDWLLSHPAPVVSPAPAPLPELVVEPPVCDAATCGVDATATEQTADGRKPGRRLLKAVARCGVKAARVGGRVAKAAVGRERRAARRGN